MNACRNLFSILFSISLFLNGCAQKPEEPNTLRLRLKQDLTTLDPAFIVDVDGGKVAAKLFNGLVKYDNELTIVGDLAEKWEISKNGQRYRFFLKPNILFSNGRRLTSKDVQFSFQRIQDKQTLSPRKWTFDAIDYIETPNKEIVEIMLKKPFSPFLSLLTLPSAYILPKEELLKAPQEFRRNPIGTGPYTLKEWKTSTQIALKKNPLYFEGAPHLNQIIYKIIPEDFVTVGEFERKLLDAIEIPRADFQHYTEDKELKPYILDQTGLNTYYLGFNCQKAPFSSKKLRQAINFAINKTLIAKKVLEGRCQIATGPVPPPLNQNRKALTEHYVYSPKKAEQLIEEAKIKLPLKINFFINQDKEVFSIASLIKEDLKKVGIEANLILRDWSAFKEAINKGEADCFFLSWWADYPDIENFLFPTFHSQNFGGGGNRAFYHNPKVDLLLEQAQKTSLTHKREALYQQAQNQIIEDAPWAFLWHRKTYFVRQPYLQNFQLFPVYTMEKATEIVLEN